MKQLLLALIVNQQNRFSNADEPVTLPTLTRMHIAMGHWAKDRDTKLKIFQELLNLPHLESTKDLTMAQAVAFTRLCEQPSFQSYLEATYGRSTQKPA